MMSIISELKNRGINVFRTDQFFKGIYNTPKGIVVTRNKSKCENGIYFLENDAGKTFPCNNQTIYVLSGTGYKQKVTTKEEAEQLVNEGKIFSFKGLDLYSEYYNFQNDKDLECCCKYGYSTKSREYIEAVMKEIGLNYYTDTSNGSMCEEGDPTVFDIDCIYNLYFNAQTEVGQLHADLWIAQTCYRTEIDDFAVIKMYFNHKPSESDLRKAFVIRKFEHHPIEVFTCWECNHMVNWLELDGDIEEKYNMAQECYCGC